MRCLKCEFENREGAKFCLQCGNSLESKCHQCSKLLPLQARFCDGCGHKLDEPLPKAQPLSPSDSARKHVTVLFSDMSGYTAMTEKMDPEEVKEVMGKIFGEISKVVAKYGGFIEKFIGDAVMALFGVPSSHEDDPVRAIKASREIHDIVSSLSTQFEKRIGKALCMHTGICTGLVVTGEVNLEKGTHGVLGDTINTAARLSGLAKAGEIVISPDTHHRAEGYFNFEALEPTTVKGKGEPIKPYRVISPKDDPTKTHRLSGMRAELIGRKVEMAQLQEAVTNLKQGKGSIFFIVGDAGTGKSRLIEEFKNTLDLNTIQWREGHAYAYSQNIPYFPLIDLLSRIWQIQEGDNPEQVRKKVETGAGFLIGDRRDLIPYLGSLYSLKYPEIENVSPDYWKAKLHEAVQLIFVNLCKKSPSIVCIEDLHWADPSSNELLRIIMTDLCIPVLFICSYRPQFHLLTNQQLSTMKNIYHEIRLRDLSPSDTQNMVESLLKSEIMPRDLRRFIQTQVEGNPFYLEEVVNSLTESEILVHDNGQWRLTRSISQINLPSTIHGIISARVDRLERETKRTLQEASVIGRVFLYEILKRITDLTNHVDRCLSGLEKLDLVRIRTLQPELEYIFKHALTQDVVYNGLLKKDRRALHERIGLVMEQLFRNRLPEFYETMAFHFKQGMSQLKAVDYLMKSAEKSHNRYSVEEAHQYYKGAYELLINYPERTKAEDTLLIDLLLNWCEAFHTRGDFKGLLEVLIEHEKLAESLGDDERLGIFYAYLGHALDRRRRLRDAYQFLLKSLELGERANSRRTIGYACAFLAFACADLGFLDEAIFYGEMAQEISWDYESDGTLFRIARAGLGFSYFFRGEVRKLNETSLTLMDYSKRWSNMRCETVGYIVRGFSRQAAGDLSGAIDCYQKTIQVSPDPQYISNSKLALGMCYVSTGQFQEAEEMLRDVIRFTEEYGYEFLQTMAQSLFGLVMISKGNLNQGMCKVKDATQAHLKNEERCRWAISNLILGKVYLKMIQGGGKKSFSFLIRNIGFLMKTVPFAHRKAKDHFTKAIQTAKEIGAKSVLGQVYLDIGQLSRIKGRTDEARKYISDAIQLFEECEADVFLKQAKEALAALQ